MSQEILIAQFGDDVPDGKTELFDFCNGAFWEKMKEEYDFDQEMIDYYEGRLDCYPNSEFYNKLLADKYRKWCSEPRGAGYVAPGRKK